MKRLVLCVLCLFGLRTPAFAQQPAPTGHEGMQMPMSPGQNPLGIDRARDGSGTSWLPDASSPGGAMWHRGRLMLMLHGRAFVQYIDVGSDRDINVGSSRRGDRWFGSTNWLMGMGQLPLAGGQLQARAMVSAEPWTVGRCGYPNLLQTGELCRGFPLHDRQHPHDLFMELAASYRRAITGSLAFELYGGPVGEPALGPTAFPHRLSAAPNPISPIAHHWLDSTHISFGVATAGLYGRKWKAEASLFNGREPNDRRHDITRAPLASYSGRFWLLPSPQWAIQVSAGRLKESDYLHFFEDVDRITASVTHQRLVGNQTFATTIAWGQNRDPLGTNSAFLAETAIELSADHTVFGRAEVTGKNAHELDLPHDHENMQHGATFRLVKVQAGYTRWLLSRGKVKAGAGGSAGLSILPSGLKSGYGSRTAGEFSLFLTTRF